MPPSVKWCPLLLSIGGVNEVWSVSVDSNKGRRYVVLSRVTGGLGVLSTTEEYPSYRSNSSGRNGLDEPWSLQSLTHKNLIPTS